MSADESDTTHAQADEDLDATESAQTRASWLSTALVLIVVVPCMLVFAGAAYGVLALDINAYYLAAITLAFLAAIAYTFGPDALKAAAEVRGNA